MANVGIIGAGGWGLALANILVLALLLLDMGFIQFHYQI